MPGQLLILLLIGVCTVPPAVDPQRGSKVREPAKGVPAQYAGNWVCQTSAPGYNLLPPHADPSRPATDKMSTSPMAVVMKFSLRTDGSYEAPNAKGHYSFDSATKAITWLDGPYQKTVTKTQIGKRNNGAPKIGFVLNKRYYGCFMSKPRP